jgi:uncharacterized protein (TIGR00369 family)
VTRRPDLPEDIVDDLNARRGGFNELMGLRFVSASYDEVRGEVEVGPHLVQPYGIVHGGVLSAMVETLASVGAALNARADGRSAVGLDNATSFLRAVREGTLHGCATPLSRGRRTHVWEVRITDDDDRLVAHGRVRMMCLEGGAQVAGETVAVKG